MYASHGRIAMHPVSETCLQITLECLQTRATICVSTNLLYSPTISKQPFIKCPATCITKAQHHSLLSCMSFSTQTTCVFQSQSCHHPWALSAWSLYKSPCESPNGLIHCDLSMSSCEPWYCNICLARLLACTSTAASASSGC